MLRGGTDAGEMALFAVIDLPEACPDQAAIEAMRTDGSLLRLPIGGDGHYGARVLIDEAVPFVLSRFCSQGPWSGVLRLREGHLGFGGVESAWRGFPANPAIRTDASVPPGEYDVTAFVIEPPREAIQHEIDDRIGARAARVLRIHGTIVVVWLLLVVLMGVFIDRAVAAVMAAVGLGSEIAFRRSPILRRLDEERRAIEGNYPMFVIHLRTRVSGGEA